MGNKRFINSDAGTKLEFLNERVINYKKNTCLRLFMLLLILAFAAFTLVCIVYECLKPGFSLSDFKNNFNNKVIKSSLGEIKESFTTNIQEVETTDKEIDSGQAVLNNMLPEEIVKYSICSISAIDKLNSNDVEFVDTGVVIKVEDKINILTYYENVANHEEVLVTFSAGNNYVGKVSRLSKDYGISLVEVDSDEVSKEELEEIKAVNISYASDYVIGKSLCFIGSTLEKNIIIKKGSLTLSSNTVSIIDAQLRIISTDIVADNVNNGFIFDEKGCLYAILNKSNYLQRGIGSYIVIDSMELYLAGLLNDTIVPCIGIYGKNVTDEVINTIDHNMPLGIYISKIKKDSPAYDAGIVHGDVVVMINNKEIRNFRDYNKELRMCNIGDEVTVIVMRKGKDQYKKIEYKVVVGGLE